MEAARARVHQRARPSYNLPERDPSLTVGPPTAKQELECRPLLAMKLPPSQDPLGQNFINVKMRQSHQEGADPTSCVEFVIQQVWGGAENLDF